MKQIVSMIFKPRYWEEFAEGKGDHENKIIISLCIESIRYQFHLIIVERKKKNAASKSRPKSTVKARLPKRMPTVKSGAVR